MTHMVFKSKIIKISTFCALFLLLPFCSSEDEDYIPDVPVYVELSLTNELAFLGVGQTVSIIPDSNSINIQSSLLIYPNSNINPYSIPWKIFGKGLIIYRESFSTYLVYDRTCTYKVKEQYCGVEIQKNILLAVCPCCGSKYMLTAGASPTNDSEAYRSLVEYRAEIINYGTRLRITK